MSFRSFAQVAKACADRSLYLVEGDRLATVSGTFTVEWGMGQCQATSVNGLIVAVKKIKKGGDLTPPTATLSLGE